MGVKFLAVIDMQSTFPASEGIIQEVVDGVNKFGGLGYHIILVEYTPYYGPTWAEVVNEVKKWPNITVQKHDDDGGREVIKALKRSYHNQPIEEILCCGVNKCFCVGDTARTLRNNGINVKVIKSLTACNCRACERKKKVKSCT